MTETPMTALYEEDPSALDMTPRYAPDRVYRVQPTGRYGYVPVQQYIAHRPGHVPPRCPVRPSTARPIVLELKTLYGSTWETCTRAYINAELRMVVEGCPTRYEVRMKWAVVPEGHR